MTLSTKRALLNYLEFLKSSGYLYLESGEGSAPAPPVQPPAMSLKKPTPKTPAAPPPAPARPPSQASPKPAPARRRPPGPDTTPDLFAPAAPTPAPPSPVPPALEGPTRSRAERIACLESAQARAEACRACPLGSKRNKLVFGDGDPEARIVFVGEAPGADEDATGIPFVGRAGQLLNQINAAIGFRREEVYICNTLKCRPPGNRDPLPSEKDACEHFLVEQLEILRPSILVALGTHAAQYLCRSELTISRLRGRWHNYHGVPLLATFHPAYLLRNPSAKPQSWEDFKMIHAKYIELNPADPRKLWRKGEG